MCNVSPFRIIPGEGDCVLYYVEVLPGRVAWQWRFLSSVCLSINFKITP
jgi:hypothetical protein